MSGPFTWRGLAFLPAEDAPTVYRSARIPLGERSADWQVCKIGAAYYARLRIGSDQYPGRGESYTAALDSAEAEAGLVLRLLQATLRRREARARMQGGRRVSTPRAGRARS